MLEQLRIKNFKGWKDTGDIEMAPITLFFGADYAQAKYAEKMAT